MELVETRKASAHDHSVDRRSTGEVAVHLLAKILHGFVLCRKKARHREEVMHLAIKLLVGHRHTRLAEAIDIGLNLVPQNIILRRNHERRRQIREIFGPKWRRIRMAALFRIRNIMIPEPSHNRRVKEELIGRIRITRPVHVGIAHGIDQDLE